MAVIGVAHDDVLNLRVAPGTDQSVLAGLAPTQADMVATGRSRILRQVIWFELEADASVGWASASFLGYLGVTDDVTSQVVAEIGEIPVAETMLDLGLLVAETLAIEEEGFSSRITMTVAPSVGDLGEVTYDVVGLQDDALRGFRLVVFGTPTDSGEGFSLKSVEATSLCGRGVTAGGLCT
jgi:hypothetical protein